MKNRLIFGLIAAFTLIVGRGVFSLNAATAPTLKSNSQVTRSSEVQVNSTSTPSLVTHVVDGDTIVVLINGVSEKVRLIGVDTPETVDPRKPVQCFGKEASKFTTALLSGKEVYIESDPTQGDRDKYGRLLRYVFLMDGTLANKEIISGGYGHEYTYRIPYEYQKEFEKAEQTAQEQQKGLWLPNVCNS